MKLPNCLTSAQWGLPSIAVIILLVGCLEHTPSALANHHQESLATNEIPTALKDHHHPVASLRTNFSQFSRDVTDLRLSPDLRSIKLRWSYKHSDENRPESFRIRYCELTSWMAEIKCRHKEMPVRGLHQSELHEPPRQPAAVQLSLANDSNPTVITMASVQSVAPHLFETQIFDLRALTNYTFHVQVAHFVDEPAAQATELKPVAITRQRPSRRLDLARENGLTNSISADSVKLAKIETTKPFSAEAVKCLAHSSEVLVNTGRYFGGRISVEGQQDGRCQLMGNKSSEQAVYSFHIDHQACHSKVTDGNRIETMILVHENKDILTHNTARFLVQCNIGQESFTVKASISLPKVINNLGGGNLYLASHTRPAMITPLGSKPSRSSAGPPEEQNFDRVHLGSMPGVYRLIRADSQPALAQLLENSARPPTSNYLDGAQTSATSSSTPPPSQTVTTIASGETTSALTASRQSAASQSHSQLSSRSQRQSKGLTASDSLLPLPKPVDVSSRILFVERASEAQAVSAPIVQREPRLMVADAQVNNGNTAAIADLHKHQSTDHSNEKQKHSQEPMMKRENSSKLTLSNGATGIRDHEDAGEPVIMTNNHRVAGDFISLDQHLSNGLGQRARSNDQQVAASDFSIKYSANKVHGYSLNKLQHPMDDSQMTTQTIQTPRSRSGRMRQIDSTAKPIDSTDTLSNLVLSEHDGKPNRAGIESRMGDMAQTFRHDVLVAEGSNPSEPITLSSTPNATTNSSIAQINGQPSLAHNITGAIIRWSLKTLGNLARKSLESLTVEEPDGDLDAKNREIDAHSSSEPALMSKATLLPPTITSATRSSSSSQKSAPRVSESPVRHSIVNEIPAIQANRVDGFVVDSRSSEWTSSTNLPSVKPNAATSIRSQASRAQPGAIHHVTKNPTDNSDQTRKTRQQHQDSDVEAAVAHLNTKPRQTAPKPSPEKATKSVETKPSEQELGTSDRYSKENSRSLWPLYGLWALCGLISLIMAAIYFVFMSPKHRAPSVSQTISSLCQHNDDERRKPSRHLGRFNDAFQQNSPVSPVGMAPESTTSSKIQSAFNSPSSFGAHTTTTTQVITHSNLGIKHKPSTSSSSPTGSAATRSTSAASSALSSPSGRENYCKNQEQYVVYTDYLVLTDDNSSLTDDHECLTRSGRRRRPPSESFA